MIVRPQEWISKPDSDGNGLLLAWMVEGREEFPIPIETHNVLSGEVMIGKNQDFNFILECAKEPEVYEDEAAYSNNSETQMASESVIPVGLFPASEDPDFVQTSRVFLNGKVVRIYEDPTRYGFDDSDILYSLTCMGNEYDVDLPGPLSKGIEIKAGNVVSCVYWVQGWPNEN